MARNCVESRAWGKKVIGPERFTRLARLFLCTALLCICALAPLAKGQGSDAQPLKNVLGVWGGYSFDSPHVIGVTSNRRLGILAFRYGRILHSWDNLSLEYTVDVFPLVLIDQPTVMTTFLPGPPPVTVYTNTGREAVYGGGVNPIGLKLNFLHQRRFETFGAFSLGLVTSVRPVPLDVPGEDQFNFTFDLQAGFEVFNSSRDRAWMFGYRFQHISNAYRSSLNPGMDANVIFVGYSFFK